MTTQDGSRTLMGPAEAYKSAAGALTEARHTFLEGSLVGERLRSLKRTRVLEVGFGGGLLFLVTAALAHGVGAELEHVGLELSLPTTAEQAALAYEELLAPSPLPAAYTAWRATLGHDVSPGSYAFSFGGVSLTLIVGDAREAKLAGGFDAIYHDAFSPAALPELWEEGFLVSLSGQLRPGGTLVTFSVAGRVRRALEQAGLEVSKLPGPPGGKREMLRGVAPSR